MNIPVVAQLSDQDLESGLASAVAREREGTVQTLVYLAELDYRKLHVPAGFPSIFRYCVGRLHLSEAGAYRRIRAARVARRCPGVLEALSDGRIHLSAIVVLAPILTRQNMGELIAASTHRSTTEIERLVAEWRPRLDVPTSIHELPATPLTPSEPKSGVAAPSVASETASLVQEWSSELMTSSVRSVPAVEVEHAALDRPTESTAHGTGFSISPDPTLAPTHARSPIVEPIAPERFALHVTIGREVHDLLRQAQELLGHRLPTGDVAEVLRRSLSLLVQHLEKRKFGATSQPRRVGPPVTSSRSIPAHVKRAVWRRDGGRCTFVSEDGYRCEARSLLEFDHVVPAAWGGVATLEGMRLRCRTHNQYAAEQSFGLRFMNEKRLAVSGMSTRATPQSVAPLPSPD